MLRFGFDFETNVFGFCGVFWYPNNSVTNSEGTRGALFYVGPRFGPCCNVIVQVVFWVELLVQKRLCLIFGKSWVLEKGTRWYGDGLLDIHEYSAG